MARPARSYDIAMRKAATVVASKLATSTYGVQVKEGKVKEVPNGITFAGGLPIMRGSEFIGAVGTSGIQAIQDEQVWRAGANAINSRLQERIAAVRRAASSRRRDHATTPAPGPASSAREYAAEGNASEWFEAFYREAREGLTTVPWADLAPNTHLSSGMRQTGFDFRDKRCLTVGCGLGDDAEYLAENGGRVVAFDISPTAVAWCRERFPSSRVDTRRPTCWRRRRNGSSSSTSCSRRTRCRCCRRISDRRRSDRPRGLSGAGGTLLLVCRGRDASDAVGPMPWPLTREEVRAGPGRASNSSASRALRAGRSRRCGGSEPTFAAERDSRSVRLQPDVM